MKQLRSYLQAKDIAHHTCTEKRELVDLIKQNHRLPFTRLFNQQTATTTTTTTTQPPPTPKSGPFTNLQHTVSSFANQMNNFATNIQDYVANTVSDAINITNMDQPTNNPHERPVPPPGNTATTNQQRRPPPPQASAASSTSAVD